MSGFSLDPSPAEFSADLHKAINGLEDFDGANKAAASRSAAAMRRRYNSRHGRVSGRASGSFASSGDTVSFGGSSVPYMMGQNFGSGGRYRQFPRQANPDHFAFSAVRAETKSIVGLYAKSAEDAIEKAF